MAETKEQLYYPCCTLSLKILQGNAKEGLNAVRVKVDKGTFKASIPTSVGIIFDKIKRLSLDKGHEISDADLKKAIEAKLEKKVAERLAAKSRAEFVALTQGADAAVDSVEIDNLSKQIAKQKADADAVINAKDAKIVELEAKLAKKK